MKNKEKQQALMAKVRPLHAFLNNVQHHLESDNGMDDPSLSVLFPHDSNRQRIISNLKTLNSQVTNLIAEFERKLDTKKASPIHWDHEADTLSDAMHMDKESFEKIASDLTASTPLLKALMILKLIVFYAKFPALAKLVAARLDNDEYAEAKEMWLDILIRAAGLESKSRLLQYLIENIDAIWHVLYECDAFPLKFGIEFFKGMDDTE